MTCMLLYLQTELFLSFPVGRSEDSLTQSGWLHTVRKLVRVLDT